MSLSFVMWAMSSFARSELCHVRKDNRLLPAKCFVLAEAACSDPEVTPSRITEQTTWWLCRKNGIENYFYIFGGKDERSQDLIQGITLAGVFFDEVALMPESFVNQATGRCSVKGSKFWFNCNPDGPYHWFKVNWIDKATGYLGKEQDQKESDRKKRKQKVRNPD